MIQFSIRFNTTQMNLSEYMLYFVMHELFLNKMLQKLYKYLNRWRSYGKN